MNIFKVRNRINIRILLLMILIPLVVGWISGAVTSDSREIYGSLKQPSFAPPGWIFPVVWNILYILMGIASYRIIMLRADNINITAPYTLYLVQLFFNFLWSIIFFGILNYGLALAELLLLWMLIIITLIAFYKKDSIAGYLLIPYLLWVSFAGILNYAVWVMNK